MILFIILQLIVQIFSLFWIHELIDNQEIVYLLTIVWKVFILFLQ